MRSAIILALALTAAACSPPPASPPPAAQADSAMTAPAPVETAAAPAIDTATPTAAPASAGKASAWTIDAAHSTIHFSVNHKVYGALGADFKNWNAKVTFDPADLPHSSVSATVPMTGVKLGQPDADAQWNSAEWADTAHFPNVTFNATNFKSLGGDKYQAVGTVKVKGHSVPVTMPFMLKINGNQADVTGALALDRTKLDIGMQSDAPGDWVDKTINVTVKVRATKS